MKFLALCLSGMILCLYASTAHADCAKPAPGFDTGYCQSKAFAGLDFTLNRIYRGLLMRLEPDPRARLIDQQILWLRHRDKRCTLVKPGATYLDFGCAAHETAERISVLQAQRPALPAPAMAAHGCAIFGSRSSLCRSYPAWRSGRWKPPAQAGLLHVLVVGGGGGGGASIERGIGGTGGGSGEVVTATTKALSGGVEVRVGQKGAPGLGFRQPGGNGGASSFGQIIAAGGGGGQPYRGGNSAAGNGGGGAGGGSYHNASGGAGGAGGTGGMAGTDGNPGTDPVNPVQGTRAGNGGLLPALGFNKIKVLSGRGGKGGAFSKGENGYGGGGGGGGGGILLGETDGSPRAGSGNSVMAGNGNHSIVVITDGHGGILINWLGRLQRPASRGDVSNRGGMGGAGGTGYGAGGGGGGNNQIGAAGGVGAPGVVYVEW